MNCWTTCWGAGEGTPGIGDGRLIEIKFGGESYSPEDTPR